MQMFETFLASIPSNRSEMVNDFEIPDLTVSPYIWEPDPPSSDISSSFTSLEIEEHRSVNTESSMALSRALTDSDIDYDRYRRFKRMNIIEHWEAMRRAMAAFPADHLTTLSSLQSDSIESAEDSIPYEPLPRDEALLLRMEQFIDDCRVFEPDDPSLLELEEALQSLDLETLYADLDSIP